MNNIHKLKLLTWKYLYLRQYHWIVSLLEITFPILVVYLVIRISQHLIGFNPIEEPVTIDHPTLQSKLVGGVNKKYEIVLYTPENSITKSIMNTTMRLCK